MKSFPKDCMEESEIFLDETIHINHSLDRIKLHSDHRNLDFVNFFKKSEQFVVPSFTSQFSNTRQNKLKNSITVKNNVKEPKVLQHYSAPVYSCNNINLQKLVEVGMESVQTIKPQMEATPEEDTDSRPIQAREFPCNGPSSYTLDRNAELEQHRSIISDEHHSRDRSSNQNDLECPFANSRFVENPSHDTAYGEQISYPSNYSKDGPFNASLQAKRPFLKKGSRNARSVLPKQVKTNYHYYCPPIRSAGRCKLSRPGCIYEGQLMTHRPSNFLDTKMFSVTTDDSHEKLNPPVDQALCCEKTLTKCDPRQENTEKLCQGTHSALDMNLEDIVNLKGHDEMGQADKEVGEEPDISVETPMDQAFLSNDVMNGIAFLSLEGFLGSRCRSYGQLNKQGRCLGKIASPCMSPLWYRQSSSLSARNESYATHKRTSLDTSAEFLRMIEDLQKAFYLKELRYRRLIERLGYQLYLEKTKNLSSVTANTEIAKEEMNVQESINDTSANETYSEPYNGIHNPQQIRSDGKILEEQRCFSLKDAWEPFESELRRLDATFKGDLSFGSNPGEYIQEMDLNDTVIQCPSRGWDFRFFENGDIRGVSNHGYTYYHFAKDDVYTIELPSGIVYNCFSDGQIDCHFPNGIVHVQLPQAEQTILS